MATRAIVRLIDDAGEGSTLYAVVYHHYDGYPEHRGVEVAKYLESGRMVNGIGMDPMKVWNGFDCFAASYIANFKEGPGNTYLCPPTLDTDMGQEYEYEVRYLGGNRWTINVDEVGWGDDSAKRIFTGTPKELITEYGQEDGNG